MIDSVQSPTVVVCAKLAFSESCTIVIATVLPTLLTSLSPFEVSEWWKRCVIKQLELRIHLESPAGISTVLVEHDV